MARKYSAVERRREEGRSIEMTHLSRITMEQIEDAVEAYTKGGATARKKAVLKLREYLKDSGDGDPLGAAMTYVYKNFGIQASTIPFIAELGKRPTRKQLADYREGLIERSF